MPYRSPISADPRPTRRAFLARATFAAPAAALLASCRTARAPFAGYAFIANQEGGALAAVDLEVMAVARHIPIDGAPSQVIAAQSRPAVYALTPGSGAVHEIDPSTLRFTRKADFCRRAVSMSLSRDEQSMFLLAAEPRSLIRVDLETLKVEWSLRLPETPVDFALSPYTNQGAIGSARTVRFVNLDSPEIGDPLGFGNYGQIRYLFSGQSLIAADLDRRQLSVYDAASGAAAPAGSRLITHLPVAVRPDHLCFNQDGGQLFVTGEGADTVVVVYPYNTPQVAGTRLAGRAPGPMAVSQALLFIASPESGEVSILEIATSRVIAVVPVGSDPGPIVVTPDDEYVLILNRGSGDVSVLRIPNIVPNRYRTAPLLTVIPVGSRPVSAALRAV